MLFHVGTAWGGVRAKTIQPDTLGTEGQQQFLYYFYKAEQLIKKGEIGFAWEVLQFCHKLNPTDATVNHYMGRICEASKHAELAFLYYRRAYELEPNTYWYEYSYYLLKSNHKKSITLAFKNLEHVAKNNPKDENLHRFLQDAYIEFKDYKRALMVQDRLDTILGYGAQSAIQRYRLNASLNNTSQALHEVERYLEEDPNNVQFLALRTQLYEITQQPSYKMVIAYKALLQFENNNLGLINNLAWHLCLLREELELAEKLSRRTIMEDPTNPVFLDTYAWILYHSGNYGDAFFYIQRALENATSDNKAEVLKHYKAILNKLKP